MEDRSDGAPKKPQPGSAHSLRAHRENDSANAIQRAQISNPEKGFEAGRQFPTETVREIPADIAQRYVRDKDRFYLDRAKAEIAFEDRGTELKLGREPPAQAIRDTLLIAEARGWKDLAISGTPTFKQNAYVEARLMGIGIRNYAPNKQTVVALQARRDQVAEQLLQGKRIARPEPALARAYAHIDALRKALGVRVIPSHLRETATRALQETLAQHLKQGGEIKSVAAAETYQAEALSLRPSDVKASVPRASPSLSLEAGETAKARAKAVRQFNPQDWPQTDDRLLRGAYAALREVKETIGSVSNLTPEQKDKVFEQIRNDVAARLERGQTFSADLIEQRAQPRRSINRDRAHDQELDR